MPYPIVFKSVGRGRITVRLTPHEEIRKPDPPSKNIGKTEVHAAAAAKTKKWAGAAGRISTPSSMPAKSKVPRWKRVLKMAGINVASTGTHTIIQAVFGENIYLSHVTFTVGGEVNITFYDGNFPMTGPMDFGGADEPRGAVMDHGRSPIMCGLNNAWKINLDASKQVSGYVTYYTLPGAEE